ncbi:DUF6191 domain-containing protein [Georgenia wangjunii]|uniref:DUF6191 domain-containing protein n=1 Tax=Georgenia wangjunii TaxID=3117730 RepID=UPI002F268EAF
MFDEVAQIFEPGLKHLFDERERQRHEVQVPGDAAPPNRIDLESGVVYVDEVAEPDDGTPGSA